MRLRFAFFFLIPALLSADRPNKPKQADPEHIAKTVTVKDADFDDVAAILHITKKSAKVTLNADRPQGRFVIEFYRDGEKLAANTTIEAAGYNVKLLKGHKDKIECCLQALDMDYVTLGDGKKNHCRLLLKLHIKTESGGLTSGATVDVPKETFDFGKGTSWQAFSAMASTDKDVPLFWLMANSNNSSGGNTVKGVLEANQKGDIAIVSLRLFE